MGYLLIDNTESGGIKEEFDTKSCKHCQGAVKVFRPPYTHQHNEDCQKYGCDREQYYDPRCNGILCRWCGRKLAKTGVCDIYRREMEKALTKYHSNRMWERLTGLGRK